MNRTATLWLPLAITVASMVCAPDAWAVETIVLTPGKTLTVPLKGSSTIEGRALPGAKRKKVDFVANVRVKPMNTGLEVQVVKRRALRFKPPQETGKLWTVQFSVRYRKETYLRRRRHYEWVYTGSETVKETVQVVIDLPRPPTIELPLGVNLDYPFPAACTLEEVESNREKYVFGSIEGNRLRIESLGLGPGRLKVDYRLGDKKFTQRIPVKVVPEARTRSMSLEVGGSEQVFPADLAEFPGREPLVILGAAVTQGGPAVQVLPHGRSLEFTGTAAGEGLVRIWCQAGTRKKKIRYLVDMAVSVEAAEGGG